MKPKERAEEVFYKYINHHALYEDDGPRILDRLTLAITDAEREMFELCCSALCPSCAVSYGHRKGVKVDVAMPVDYWWEHRIHDDGASWTTRCEVGNLHRAARPEQP
jgi:hypothetical protein